MKLHFLGATRQVTGSCYCLEADGRRILVDCGMFQERAFVHRNWDSCPLPAATIDAVVLTHAHIDHCGLLPRLVRQGFAGPVYATQPTVDLTDIMLEDAARIQAEDVKYKKKRHQAEGRTGPHPYEPLFTAEDVAATLPRLVGVPFQQTRELAQGIQLTFHDAGHILGSASLQFRMDQPAGPPRSIVFSGDVGQRDKPLIRDPAPPGQADFLVLESTYGGRKHENGGAPELQLREVIQRACGRGGKLLIPVFALERAQELLYHIGQLAHAGQIASWPVFLDSPMAVDVTSVFHRHRDVYDAETWQRISAGMPPLDFPGLHFSRTTEQSIAINGHRGPAIILSTSGMCTAGRIKHHLKRHLGDAKNMVLFVGYQAQGTLGRQLLEKAPAVRIHGSQHAVHAEIAQAYGFSGHADHDGLLEWASAFDPPPARTFLTHGDETAAHHLAQALRQRHWKVAIPQYRELRTLDD